MGVWMIDGWGGKTLIGKDQVERFIKECEGLRDLALKGNRPREEAERFLARIAKEEELTPEERRYFEKPE